LKDLKFDLDGLTSAERWRYHAYDYAFLRFRNEPQDSGYALDPHGKWFNEGLVQASARVYVAPRPPPMEPIPRADIEPDPELAAHFRRQDDERIPLKRQIQVHGERLSNGEPTPEMLAFTACCVRQQQANEKIFIGRNRNVFRRETQTTSKQVLNALGVSATERDRDVWFWNTMAPYIHARLPDQQASALIAAWQIEDEDATRTVDALDRERKLRAAAAD
jgi:hypothetical protein